MPDQASRRAWWTRLQLLVWILHRRDSAVDEIEEVEAEKGARLLPSMEAGLMDYWATFARRGSGKIPTPGRVLAAHRFHDVNMPARVRVDAAKILVDRAGFVAGPPAPQLYEKELESMSIAELEAHLHKLEANMKDVTPAATDDESANDAPADDTPPRPH
jgi:hypothetical protein